MEQQPSLWLICPPDKGVGGLVLKVMPACDPKNQLAAWNCPEVFTLRSKRKHSGSLFIRFILNCEIN